MQHGLFYVFPGSKVHDNTLITFASMNTIPLNKTFHFVLGKGCLHENYIRLSNVKGAGMEN